MQKDSVYKHKVVTKDVPCFAHISNMFYPTSISFVTTKLHNSFDPKAMTQSYIIVQTLNGL